MILLRWLHGRMLGNPTLPRRDTWIAIFATFMTLGSWMCGRVFT